MVMNGINEGLLETEAYSPVFVFTDAGSKDIEERDTVLSLSKVRIIFSFIEKMLSYYINDITI